MLVHDEREGTKDANRPRETREETKQKRRNSIVEL